jgi:uncharacterized membrane protein (DUF485 family)
MSDSAEQPAAEPSPALEKEAQARRALAFKLAAVVCAVFFPLPILGSFTSVLDGVVFSGVSWAWLYAFAQFGVAIVVGRLYSRRAGSADTRRTFGSRAS